MDNQDILLEAGTNEIEILEFFLGQQSFGINVLKIKQILKYEESTITPLPNAYPSVKGSFLFQGQSTPLVDLNSHINIPSIENPELRRIVLVCEFNNTTTAFITDGVDKIHRLSWEDIQPPPALSGDVNDNVTGILIMEGRQILMLDFENIVHTIGGDTDTYFIAPETSDEEKKRIRRENIKLIVADDSRMMRQHLEERLVQANYVSITLFDNGTDVHQAVLALKEKAEQEGRPITDYLIIIVTDIEMPGMDGLTLCKMIKSETPEVYVLILSSLINKQLALRCKEVGADAYLSKKETNRLISSIDQLCL